MPFGRKNKKQQTHFYIKYNHINLITNQCIIYFNRHTFFMFNIAVKNAIKLTQHTQLKISINPHHMRSF